MQNHKIVLCGDTFVGKSAIFTSIQHGGEVRHEQLQSTISGTFAQIKVPKDPQNGETQVKLQLWDTAGDERLRHITRNYFNGASGAVIVYDVTSRDSMQVANEWLVWEWERVNSIWGKNFCIFSRRQKKEPKGYGGEEIRKMGS